MFTHRITSTYATDEGNAISALGTYTGTAEVGYDGTVAATTDLVEVDIAWIRANVHALLLYSSQALTIKTNNSGSPIDTIVLTAGQAVVWGSDHLEANPVAHDVTKLFLSNDTANIATVKIRVLVA
jgi:hypothetical protein